MEYIICPVCDNRKTMIGVECSDCQWPNYPVLGEKGDYYFAEIAKAKEIFKDKCELRKLKEENQQLQIELEKEKLQREQDKLLADKTIQDELDKIKRQEEEQKKIRNEQKLKEDERLKNVQKQVKLKTEFNVRNKTKTQFKVKNDNIKGLITGNIKFAKFVNLISVNSPSEITNSLSVLIKNLDNNHRQSFSLISRFIGGYYNIDSLRDLYCKKDEKLFIIIKSCCKLKDFTDNFMPKKLNKNSFEYYQQKRH